MSNTESSNAHTSMSENHSGDRYKIPSIKRRNIAASLAALCGFAIAATSTNAFADCTNNLAPASNCSAAPATVALVEFGPTAGLIIQQIVSGVFKNYYGQLSAQAGCTAQNQSADTLKQWSAMAQAALLAGKQLKVYYNVCGSNNLLYINAVDLNQ